jgi:hypothetical protein
MYQGSVKPGQHPGAVLGVVLLLGNTQRVQVLLGLCSLKIQDVNYFQKFTLFIQNSLLLNQYIAGID